MRAARNGANKGSPEPATPGSAAAWSHSPGAFCCFRRRARWHCGAWRLAALASLVFRSALTPEHAEGGWAGDGPFFDAPRLMALVRRLRDDRRGARHWAHLHATNYT